MGATSQDLSLSPSVWSHSSLDCPWVPFSRSPISGKWSDTFLQNVQCCRFHLWTSMLIFLGIDHLGGWGGGVVYYMKSFRWFYGDKKLIGLSLRSQISRHDELLFQIKYKSISHKTFLEVWTMQKLHRCVTLKRFEDVMKLLESFGSDLLGVGEPL